MSAYLESEGDACYYDERSISSFSPSCERKAQQLEGAGTTTITISSPQLSSAQSNLPQGDEVAIEQPALSLQAVVDWPCTKHTSPRCRSRRTPKSCRAWTSCRSSPSASWRPRDSLSRWYATHSHTRADTTKLKVSLDTYCNPGSSTLACEHLCTFVALFHNGSLNTHALTVWPSRLHYEPSFMDKFGFSTQ